MCRPFLYTVLVVSVFSQPQLTTKKEIGNPFGKVYLFFSLGLFCNIPFLFYTVGKNKKKIQEYIKNQLQQDQITDQLSLKEFTDPFTGSKGTKA